MSRAWQRNVFRLAIAATLAVPGGAAADPPRTPFVVVLQGNASPVPTGDPCVLLNTETGSGESAALGTLTWESQETVDLCANGNAEVDGQFTITAASGDRLQGTYRTSAHLDFQAASITAVGRYKLTGGTGAFGRARGKGVIAASGSLAPPFEFEGGLFGAITQ